jgi:hypothetical protein
MTIVTPGRQTFVVDTPRPPIGSAENRWWAPMTCEEARCKAFVLGWKTELDESIPQHAAAAAYIRKECGREFEECHDVEGLTTFIFPPGQTCFEGEAGNHKTKTDTVPLLSQVTAQGVVRQFEKGDLFNECMNEEMYMVERALQRG